MTLKHLAPLALLVVGCVTQGQYDALQAEKDQTQATLAQRQRELVASEKNVVTLQAALDEEKAHSASLGAQLAQVEAERAAMLKDKTSLQASVAEMTAALKDLQARKAAADARIAEFRNLLDKFKSLIDAGKLKVKIVEGRLVVVLATDVLFGSGSATLSKEGKAAVGEVAGLLASIPKRKFQIEGHTDNVPVHTAQYPSNWELAAARALTVLKTALDAGMPSDRISAASFGDSKPAASNDTPEGKGSNRRIEIIIVPDLSSLPGFDELNRAGA